MLKFPEENPKELLKLFEEVYSNARIFYLLKTALDLNIFDYLDEFKSAEELARGLKTDPFLTEYILKILHKLGILEFKDNKYRNRGLANIYLRRDSEFNIITPLNYYFENIKNWENLKLILENKLKNKNESLGKMFSKVIKRMADECKCWELKKVLDYVSKYDEFKNAKKLLDLAGGHGLYAIGFSMLNENLKCYVFDLPEVIEETKKFIEKYNAKNVFTIAGDFYGDDIGSGYDIIFTSYNPGGKNPKIAKKVYDSLNKGGLFINKQFFLEVEENIMDYLNNMEWNFFRPKGLKKNKLRYTFEGDLKFSEYISYLKSIGFEILDIVDMSKLLDNEYYSSTKMIVAKKI
ncbi:methyltransferase [Methanotorris igneus]|uniref:O-methyltransferase family 2 n=1 Tax=Methanotorris igneus (strain DSM 5666 / JCM 11834 / Kol 5) TaxID=880724 RepID=F6BAY1_METIK|nr:methyltransferase [Methanotorris igneus]AEF97068.1 hypothetical protein Metig_1534 [Methanotorris igneus Kol 5]